MGLRFRIPTIFSGKKGEEAAVLYLKKKHYKIVEQNYRCRRGEIDIIAKKDNLLIFVEVKKRKNQAFQNQPSESVTSSKQKKIVFTAKRYISENNAEQIQCRFDVIEVLGEDKINHIINAFDAGVSF